jgi:hypothetical protein
MKRTPALGAIVCLVMAVMGIVRNVQFIRAGTGLPADDTGRMSYIIGMFLVPVLLLALAAYLWSVARGRTRRDQ